MDSEKAELARLALVGQAFVGLAHDLNNVLNSIVLQTSVVQLRVDEPTRRELAVIRQHGAQAAGLLRMLQQGAVERRGQFYPVSLNAVLAELLEDEAALRNRLKLELSPEGPSIEGTRASVKQFVSLLLEGARAGTKATIAVRTEKRAKGAALILALDEMPAEPAEDEPSLLETFVWRNLDEVGQRAGKSLLRQLGGEATETRGEGGLILRFTWGS